MTSYLKFCLTPFYLFLMATSLVIDGWIGLSIAFLVVVSIVVGELSLGDDISTPNYRFPFLLDFSLFINVPLFLVLLYLYLDKVSNSFEWYYLLYIPILGLLMALSLINIGHELVHRTSKKFDCEVGNWALATAWNPAFAIEHVYGHHKNIGIVEEDPVTATYGENPISFAFKAFFKEHTHAWGIETRQLKRRKQSILSFHNRILNGYLRTFIVFGLIGYFFSWQAMVIYISLGIVANYIFQLTNFIEHYGLVRIKGKPVQYHHSWNSNHVISNWILFHLPWHSHHHKSMNKAFHELEPIDNAPQMPFGYPAMIVIAFFPFVFIPLMERQLKLYQEREEKVVTV